ncbi:Pisatin demethylase [Podospora fimiseda]|uniref:Pisatin demethylase n=1 Tax=Podospora fimiseda TaxID=252190 RepID=A0AAN7H0Z1_9PEZI|nr:Pisatin demethylase [Podospora fimiseda]
MMSSEKFILDSLFHFRSGGLPTIDRALLGRVATAVLVPLVALFIWTVVAWIRSPLRRYPGPFLAGFTDLWRVRLVFTNRYADIIKELHEKYGPVVRIGPNTLDLDYPELLKTIYGTDGKWLKSDMYYSNCNMVEGKRNYNVFSEMNQVTHANMKRPIVKYFTLGNVLTLEPHLNVVISDMIKEIDKRFVIGTPKDFEFGDWISFFTWDALSDATFSRRYGYLSSGTDHDQTILLASKSVSYFAVCSQMPWLDSILDKNPIIRLGPPYLDTGLKIAMNALSDRLAGNDKHYNPSRPDYLHHFIQSKSTHPEYVSDRTILAYLVVNILAGADTTGITLTAIFHYVLSSPQCYAKLVQEVRELGFSKDEIIPYNKARQLQYLEACIREGMRLNPVVGMVLERVVPNSGLVLPDGSVVPAGTNVGANAYIVGRNKGAFGEDADEFRPERWLRDEEVGETEEGFKARLLKMNAADFSFGGGSRVCLGRHFAMLELYKTVATLVNRYDMELSSDHRWVVAKSWFVKPKSLRAKFKLRE